MDVSNSKEVTTGQKGPKHVSRTFRNISNILYSISTWFQEKSKIKLRSVFYQICTTTQIVANDSELI